MRPFVFFHLADICWFDSFQTSPALLIPTKHCLPPTNTPVYLPTIYHLCFYFPSFLCLSINLSIYPPHLSIYASIPSTYSSIPISIYLSSIYPPPSIYLFVDVDAVGTHSDNFHWLVLPSPSCCNSWLITCTNCLLCREFLLV